MFGDGEHNIAVICGRASRNLLVLDADTPEARRAVEAHLAGLGIRTWVVQRPQNGSSHDGGGHFYLRFPEAVKSTRATNLDVDVKGQGGFVLGPPSVHPDGGEYFFVERPSTICVLDDLDALRGLGLALEVAPPRRRIPSLVWRLLKDPEAQKRYPSRSEVECAICAMLCNSGFEYQTAENLLKSHPLPGKFYELWQTNRKAARAYLLHTWRKVAAWCESHDSDAILLAQQLRTWANTRPWPGRTGRTDKVIYIAHLAIAERSGRNPYRASCRELAELAGVSHVTAAKANGRLVERSLIRQVEKAGLRVGPRWELVVPNELRDGFCAKSLHSLKEGVLRECKLLAQTTHKTTGPLQLAGHDLFRWTGLNKSGAEVLSVFLRTRGPVGVTQIVGETGCSRRTIYRRLRDLGSLGVVTQAGRGRWMLVEAPDLDGLARRVGTCGIAARQREQHERERERWREALGRADEQDTDVEVTESNDFRGLAPADLNSW